MKKYLVTGSAGFIGSRTSELLLTSGNSVIGIDNLNDYYSVELKKYRLQQLGKHSGFDFVEGDIEDLSKLDNIFEKNDFDAIINLAARAGVRASIDNPFVYVSTNILGTLNLLELCKKCDIGKFVLASSSSLYAGEAVPFDESMPVNNPISQYAATKKSAEVLAHSYYHLFGIDTSVLRFFTVFGPAGRPDMSYYQFISKIYNGVPIDIYGDGNQKRDFTFIEDIAEGVLLSLKEVGFQIINLGGGRTPVTINKMIELIENKLGKKAKINYLPFHSADMSETEAQITKAQKILNWSPKISFEEGINRTVDWFLTNPNLFGNFSY